MKRINVKYVGIGLIVSGVFWLALSAAAQNEGVRPSKQTLQKTDTEVLPSDASENDKEFGNLRINWKDLGLSEEQKKQMAQKRREFQVNTASLREQLRFAERDLQAEMAKEPVDRAKIDGFLNNRAALKRQLNEAATQNLLALKGLLTPEQLEKLAGLRAELPPQFQKLQLTPEQRTKIQAILKSAMRKNRETAAQLRELRLKLQEMLLAAQKIAPEELKKLQTEIGDTELTLEKARFEMLLQTKEVLTPEQRAALQKARQAQEKREPKIPARRKGQ